MHRCPGCGADSIGTLSKLRVLSFDHPACPECGARLALYGPPHIGFVLAMFAVLLVGVAVSVRLEPLVGPPVNLAIGIPLALALLGAPLCLLMLRKASLKAIPADEYRALSGSYWWESSITFALIVAAGTVVLWPMDGMQLGVLVFVALVAAFFWWL